MSAVDDAQDELLALLADDGAFDGVFSRLGIPFELPRDKERIYVSEDVVQLPPLARGDYVEESFGLWWSSRSGAPARPRARRRLATWELVDAIDELLERADFYGYGSEDGELQANSSASPPTTRAGSQARSSRSSSPPSADGRHRQDQGAGPGASCAPTSSRSSSASAATVNAATRRGPSRCGCRRPRTRLSARARSRRRTIFRTSPRRSRSCRAPTAPRSSRRILARACSSTAARSRRRARRSTSPHEMARRAGERRPDEVEPRRVAGARRRAVSAEDMTALPAFPSACEAVHLGRAPRPTQ
jgi:hypothetical protein